MSERQASYKVKPPASHKEMMQLIKRISGQANFIGTPRLYMDLFDGDLVCAVWFNQVVYWDSKTKQPIGFYKTYAEWEAELGLSAAQVRRVADKCQKIGIVNIAFHKVYGTPKNHYLVVWDELIPLINLTFKKVEGQESELSELQESESSKEHQESATSLNKEEITTKNELLKVIEGIAPSIFPNPNKWRDWRRQLESDNVLITGTEKEMTISVRGKYDAQFSLADYWESRYKRSFSNLLIEITFKEME